MIICVLSVCLCVCLALYLIKLIFLNFDAEMLNLGQDLIHRRGRKTGRMARKRREDGLRWGMFYVIAFCLASEFGGLLSIVGEGWREEREEEGEGWR